MSLTSVSLATLVTIGATPVIVLVAELLLGRRRLDRSAVARTDLALAGLGLLVGLPTDDYGSVGVLESASAALLAAAGFAVLTLISVAFLGDRLSTASIAGATLLAAAVLSTMRPSRR